MASHPSWLCAPDSFKGTFTARAIARSLAAGLHPHTVKTLPMADGGEGTADAFHGALGGIWTEVPLLDSGSRGQNRVGRWLSLDGEHAVVDFAEGSGLPNHPAGGDPDPWSRSSFPVGQLIASALDSGARIVSLGLGGSGTLDGGVGLLQALGARFRARTGLLEGPLAARDLVEIRSVDLEPVRRRLEGVSLVLAADVENPLLGPRGSVVQYGPQKGVAVEALQRYEAGLRHLSQLLGDPGIDPGDGSAGGAGFGLRVGASGTLIRGAAYVADQIGFDEACTRVDWVVTGEGQYDQQSREGKVPWEVARRARASGAKVALVCGRILPSQLDEVKRVFDLHVSLDHLAPAGNQLQPEADLAQVRSAGAWLRDQVG